MFAPDKGGLLEERFFQKAPFLEVLENFLFGPEALFKGAFCRTLCLGLSGTRFLGFSRGNPPDLDFFLF